ncbi:MAG: TIGR02301 family protein, partial [Hyphomicrobiaceae bacterium]
MDANRDKLGDMGLSMGLLRKRSVRIGRHATRIAVLSAMILAASAPLALAQQPPQSATADSRPYDTKLLRLAELLGAVHYLRELCGANEGQFWRDTMTELMKSEGTTA